MIGTPRTMERSEKMAAEFRVLAAIFQAMVRFRAIGRVALAFAIFTLGGAFADPAMAEPATCAAAAGPRIEVTVTGLRSARGKVVITVYGDRPEDFLASGKRVELERVEAADARDGRLTACLSLPASGTYAVLVHHDEDGDRKMARNMIGLPQEGFGFSNDAPASLGPPKFDDAKFTVDGGMRKLAIRMRY